MKLKVKRKKAKGKIRKTKIKNKKLRAARQKKALWQRTSKQAKKIFSKSELKKFKQLLITQREKFVGEVEHIANDTLKKSQRDASGDLSGYSLHMADVATDHYDREFSLGIASTEQNVIYEIDEALKRMEEGSYGVCFTCERTISKKRLKAVPHAKYCVDCQQKEESIQKRVL